MSYDGSMVEQPDEPAPAALTVAAVARRLGVAPTTLRTWDRRYGLGPSARAAGAHRRYTPDDVVRLEAMRRLVLSGVTPAEAARVALNEGAASMTDPPSAPARFAGTGGRVLSIARGTPRTRGLARAAMSLDADAVVDTLDQAFAEDGVISTWDTLLRPLLVAVGERWANTGDGIDVEHLLSECTARALHRLPGPDSPLNARPVLLACTPTDSHVLPLLVLAAALAEQRLSARVLGGATPIAALTTAVRRTGPAAVVVSAQLDATADLRVFEAVPRLRPPTTMIAAGQGWPAVLPASVVYAISLQRAVDLVSTAVGG